jgi:hypothetical protein
MRTSTLIDLSEWLAADAAVHIVNLVETDPGHGVAAVVRNGLRRWIAWGDRIVVATAPVHAGGEPDAVVGVSPRLVRFAAALAQREGAAELRTTDQGVWVLGVTSGLGSEQVAHAVPEVMFTPPPGAPVAVVGSAALFEALHTAAWPPTGVDLGDPRCPETRLSLSPGAIEVTTDWRTVGASPQHITLAAEVTGAGGVVGISPRVVAWAVQHTDPDDDTTIWVDEVTGVTGIATAEWTAVVQGHTVGWAARREAVELALVDDGILPQAQADDSWLVEIDDVAVRLELLERRGQAILRCTTELVADVPPSAAVLTELNELSARLAGTRLWWDNGAIVAGFDLPSPAGLPEMMVAMIEQVVDLGPLVAALGGCDG